MAMAPTLDPAVERELAAAGEDGKAITSEMAAERAAALDVIYPKPTQTDITTFWMRQRQIMANWRLGAIAERKRRYQQDVTPDKWQKNLQDGRRFFSRLTHNELNRVVGLHVANGPRATILPSSEADRDRAHKEERWTNQIMEAAQRGHPKPIRRRFVDCLNEIGFAAYEVYLTNAYDDLDTEPHLIRDANTGELRMETDREVMRRTDAELKQKPCPFGIRYVDGLALYIDEDDEGLCAAAVVERKAFRQVFQEMYKRGVNIGTSQDYDVAADTPEPGAQGWAYDTNELPGIQTVETVRYYDRRWYAYLVAGKFVEGPVEHKLPGVPIFPAFGIVTGSPNMEHYAEGIRWGMASMELAVDDMITLALDVQFTYSRPKLVITTPLEGNIMTQASGPDTGKPVVLDLQQPGVQQLNPGQVIQNVLQGFEPYLQLPMLTTIMNLWQRSGLNPIAQGDSPGAATAGYTVNALQGAATSEYEDLIGNEATTTAMMFDFIRAMVKETIKEAVPLTVPMEGNADRVEWLTLSPDEVSSTACIVEIDATSSANRLAKRQSLMQAYKEGFITRRRVQMEGFAIDDPQAEDDQIIIDQGTQQLGTWAIQSALTKVQSAAAPPPAPGSSLPTILGPDGNPLPPSGPGGAGQAEQPAPPGAPLVGAALNQASSVPFATQPGPAALPASTAMAGQGRNMVPQPGRP